MKPIKKCPVRIKFTAHAYERELQRISQPRREIVIDILKHLHVARKSKRSSDRYLIAGWHAQYVISTDGTVITVMPKDFIVEGFRKNAVKKPFLFAEGKHSDYSTKSNSHRNKSSS